MIDIAIAGILVLVISAFFIIKDIEKKEKTGIAKKK